MKRTWSPVLRVVLVLLVVTVGYGCFGDDSEAGGDVGSDEWIEPDVAEPDIP